jgi:hypothetical protein
MKPRHALSSAAISSLFLLTLASGAFAYGHDYDHGHGWGRDHGKGHHHHTAPELDPALISNGMALLAGSVLLLMERKRRRS